MKQVYSYLKMFMLQSLYTTHRQSQVQKGRHCKHYTVQIFTKCNSSKYTIQLLYYWWLNINITAS